MDDDEAEEFVRFVDGAWQPALTDVQKQVWLTLCRPLDPRAAFGVLVKMMKTERMRPARPDFAQAYRRERADATPHEPEHPQDRSEMPDWVRGWLLARRDGDFRPWPEQERGYRQLHEAWLEGIGRDFALKHDLKSGYEWDDFAVMPQADRLDFIRRARGPKLSVPSANLEDFSPTSG